MLKLDIVQSSFETQIMYDDFAPSYNTLAGRMGWDIRKWIKPYFNEMIANKINVLDVACGTGTLGSIVRDGNCTLDGTDGSPEMLKGAVKNGRYSCLYRHDLDTKWPKQVWDLMSGKLLKVQPDFYDLAFCFGAFEFQEPEHLIKVISEVLDQLKPGGTFVFNTQVNEINPNTELAKRHDPKWLAWALAGFCTPENLYISKAYKLSDSHISEWIEYYIWTIKK